MTADMNDHGLPGSPDPDTQRRDAVFARVGEEILSTRSSRQRELSDAIYQQLRAGSEVDDIKHLIEKLSRTATEDHRRQDGDRRTGGIR